MSQGHTQTGTGSNPAQSPALSAIGNFEEGFRSFFRFNTLGLGITSLEGRWIAVNDEVCKILGYTREELLHGSWMEHTHSDDRARNQALFEQALRGEIDEYALEKRFVGKDGTLAWVNLSARCVRHTDGSPKYFLAIYRAISERKQFEATLRLLAESPGLYAGDAFLHQCVRALAETHDAAYAFAGLFEDEGRRSVRTISVWAKDDHVENFTYLLRGTPCDDVLAGSVCLIADSATTRFPDDVLLAELGVEAYFGAPLIDSRGHTLGLVAVMDVRPMQPNSYTKSVLEVFAARMALELERRQAEQERHRYERILASTDDMMAYVDRRYTYRAVNEAYATAFCRTQESIIGQPVSAVFGQPGFESLAKPFLDRCFAGQPQVVQRWMDLPGRGRCHLDIHLTPFDDGRRVDGCIVSARDTTERRENQQALIASEARYRTLYDFAPAGIWEEDWSAVKQGVDELRAAGITDLDTCFRENTDLVTRLGNSIRIRRLNAAAIAMYDAPDEAALRRLSESDFLSNDERRAFCELLAAFAGGRASMTVEAWETTFDGRDIFVRDTVVIPAEFRDDWSRVIHTTEDITTRKRSAHLLATQRDALELIAKGTDLHEVLDAICKLAEGQIPRAMCSVLLMDDDGVHLRAGAAPSLPAGFARALDGLAIGECAGSCASAACHRKQVIVADIATDPRWRENRTLALAHGIKACWSTPILEEGGELLGTFAVSHREKRHPTHDELRVIDIAGYLAGITIERERNLRRAGAELEARVAERTAELEAERIAAGERDASIREVHRRFKNNLQGILGLLREHERSAPGAGEVLDRASSQIAAVALVHGLQAGSTREAVMLATLVSSIAGATNRPDHINITCEIDDVAADTWIAESEAVPIALVINELISNAIQHLGGTQPRERRLRVHLGLESGQAVLRVVNTCNPLPEGADLKPCLERNAATALDLMRSLTPSDAAHLGFELGNDGMTARLTIAPPLITPPREGRV